MWSESLDPTGSRRKPSRRGRAGCAAAVWCRWHRQGQGYMQREPRCRVGKRPSKCAGHTGPLVSVSRGLQKGYCHAEDAGTQKSDFF